MIAAVKSLWLTDSLDINNFEVSSYQGTIKTKQ